MSALCWSIARNKPFCLYFQESVYDRIKKTGGPNPFNLFVIAEMECMHRLLACVRETLLVMNSSNNPWGGLFSGIQNGFCRRDCSVLSKCWKRIIPFEEVL